jgi:serine/threonine protein kinase/class 3 adenylate cyclase
MPGAEALSERDFAVELTAHDVQAADEFRRRHQVSVLTVLFTDIEDSTSLLEKLGEREYARLRGQHDRLVRSAIEREAGICIKQLGDGFLAVFSEPSSAVECAMEIQKNITRQLGLRVRIGLDMGQVAVEKAGGVARDVFGRFVNRAARIMSVAKGGHTLCSYSVWESAVGWISADTIVWREWGTVTLKGFEKEVVVYEFYQESRPAPAPSGAASPASSTVSTTAIRGIATQQPPFQFWRYQVTAQRSVGALAIEYEADDPSFARRVLLKLIRPELVGQPEIRERFYREARMGARLAHPNILSVFEMGEEHGTLYLATEWLEGESLDQLLVRRGRVPVAEAVGYMDQLCRALEFAHDHGVVHRDIKPANILLTRDGQIKLTDFGIAFLQTFPREPAAGILVGTVVYMSPEQVRGERVTGRSDIWSAGATFYELLTGQRPFISENIAATMHQIITQDPPPLRDLVPDCPPPLEAVIKRMLCKNPDERYASVTELLKELEAVGPELPTDSSEAAAVFSTTAAPETPVGTESEKQKSSVGLEPPPAPAREQRISTLETQVSRALWLDSRPGAHSGARRLLEAQGWKVSVARGGLASLMRAVLFKYQLLVLVADTAEEAKKRLRFLSTARKLRPVLSAILFWRQPLRVKMALAVENSPAMGCTSSAVELLALAEKHVRPAKLRW